MPKLKVLSGQDVIRIFKEFGFFAVDQKDSHIKLRRIMANGVKQTITVPNHDEIDQGTLGAIYRQTLRYIPESELEKYFYTK
ncbi:MAG: hypothetical protein UX07_C0047G0005 [Parcubacteria group bacterium GW2011_GWA2_45_30]|nr:MAG: hypothetical protein UX07_C0047G0005 [Parcubacteria group bacterium GW2011_GWA2_45_30]